MATMRGPFRLGSAALALATLTHPGPAGAQDALFLRIRPQADPAAIGAAGSARAALAAREAVWERSNARARAIIETVCTGCLAPWSGPPPKVIAAAAVSEIPDVRGLESDRPLGASDATPEPSTRERRP
jgi:hypothetical protein